MNKLVFAAIFFPVILLAKEVIITEANGRMWTRATVTRIDATGITFHTPMGRTRPFQLKLEELSKADQALYGGRVQAARAVLRARAQREIDDEKARRAKVMEGTYVVPTAKGEVEGVSDFHLEGNGLVVSFKTFIGEKRVLLSDLTPEWQAKVKEADARVKAQKGQVK
jgi:hypothetical protein